MRKKLFIISPIFLFVSGLILSLLFLTYACKKQAGSSTASVTLIENAKTWFETNVVTPEKEMLFNTKAILPLESPYRRFARMRKIDKFLNWESSKQYNLNGINFIITPISEKRKPFSNQEYEAFRDLIIYQDRLGNMKMTILEALGKKGTSLGNDIESIAYTAFTNMFFNKTGRTNSDLNATVIFYNRYYSPETSFQITNGIWNNNKARLINLKKYPGQRPSTAARTTTCGGCDTYYLVGYWYDIVTGEVISSEIIGEFDSCSDPSNYLPYGYYGTPDPQNQTDPCTQANLLASNSAFISKMQDLSSRSTSDSYESAYIMKDNNGSTSYTYYNGGVSGSNFNFTTLDFSGTTGMIHNHENNSANLSIFSSEDFHSLYTALISASVSNPQNFTFGLVTAQGTTYLLSVSDWATFQSFAVNTFTPGNTVQLNAFNYLYNSLINTSNSVAVNEANFVTLLNIVNGGTGLTLLKGDTSTFTNWKKVTNSNGTATYVNCN